MAPPVHLKHLVLVQRPARVVLYEPTEPLLDLRSVIVGSGAGVMLVE